jgi:hypothetical protein
VFSGWLRKARYLYIKIGSDNVYTMAKKYLLYIHDPRFDNEPHKSKVVNELLRSHYDTGKGSNGVIPMAEEPIEGMREAPMQTVRKNNLCKVHGMDKEYCALMKH